MAFVQQVTVKTNLIFQKRFSTSKESLPKLEKNQERRYLSSSKAWWMQKQSLRIYDIRSSKRRQPMSLKSKSLLQTTQILCKGCRCELTRSTEPCANWIVTSRTKVLIHVTKTASSRCQSFNELTRLIRRRPSSSTCRHASSALSRICSRLSAVSFLDV